MHDTTQHAPPAPPFKSHLLVGSVSSTSAGSKLRNTYCEACQLPADDSNSSTEVSQIILQTVCNVML